MGLRKKNLGKKNIEIKAEIRFLPDGEGRPRSQVKTEARARVIQTLWNALYRLHPALVGGCRPVDLTPFLPPNAWEPVFSGAVVRFGIPSQVLIARTV